MNDQQYFEKYLDSFHTVFSDSTKDLAYIKDIDFKYQMMTKGMLNMFNVSQIDEIKGLTSCEIAKFLNLPDRAITNVFHEQDANIKETLTRGTYLEFVPYATRATKIMVVYKTPIINPTTNNFVGIRGQITKLLWPNVIKTLFKMHGAKGLLLDHKNTRDVLKEYPLTNMQHMVLFLCLNNYSYSEIALFMSEFGHEITPIRVNDYLEQLKLIFHVRTKTQLVEKAIGLNFHVILPGDLFNKMGSIEISKETADIICCNCKLNNCNEHDVA